MLDDSLLYPFFSGLKEMLHICERYANDKKKFDASKSQSLHFSKKDDPLHIMKPILRMKHGQIIPYAENCMRLGNKLNSSSIEYAMLDSAIINLNIKTNNLLSEFLFSESIAVAWLFKSYCMNFYGSPLVHYRDKIIIITLNDFAWHGEKLV